MIIRTYGLKDLTGLASLTDGPHQSFHIEGHVETSAGLEWGASGRHLRSGMGIGRASAQRKQS
eukprot:2187589-Pyramimonas_sp.AAC.1